MSRSKHLYHIIFIKIENQTFKPCASMNLWANNKRDLFQICRDRYPDLIPFEAQYIK